MAIIVTWTGPPEFTDEDLERAVDEDIAKFDAYFRGLGNDPLTRFESSVIKTYLHWKTHGESSPPSPTTTEGDHAT